jgi:hypothetical protein
VATAAAGACPLNGGTGTGNVWAEGDILIGGLGSDTIEGRGGNDIIDGDRSLNVRISVRTNPALASTEIGSTDLMEHQYLRDAAGALTGPTLQAAVFAGTVNPGNLVAVREIVAPVPPAADCAAAAPVNCDKAVFSGPQANYTVATVAGVTTVTDNVGGDGVDTLRNIEVLQFADNATPGAPTTVSATGGLSHAVVTWAAPLLNRVPQVVTGYSVEVSLNGTVVGALRPTVGTPTTLDVTGLAGGSYTFRVLASNTAASPVNGPLSLPSVAVTVTAPSVPNAPTIGNATAGVNGAVTVRWTPPAVVAGAPILSYEVQVLNAAGTTQVGALRTAGAAATSLVVPGLANGVPAAFKVRAVNISGPSLFSALSNVVTPDNVVPTVTTRTPASGARSVIQTDNVTATFSEAVTPVTGANFVLRLGTTVIPAVVTYNAATRVATLNPNATLLADRSYTATLSGVTDIVGNPLATTTWSFLTGPAPTITAQTPAALATGVLRNSNVTATFSELMTGIAPTTVQLIRLTGGAVVPSVLTFNTTTRVMTINPNATLVGNVTYRVTITGSNTAVRDLAGNPVLTRSWNFNTGPL